MKMEESYSLKNKAEQVSFQLEQYVPNFSVSNYELDIKFKSDTPLESYEILLKFIDLPMITVQSVVENYDDSIKHFSDWCKSNGDLQNPTILNGGTSDNTITFSVTVV